MLNYVLTVVATILASESVFWLPLGKSVRTSLAMATKSMAVIRSPRISDHWKERVLLKYALTLFGETLKIALMTGIVVGIVALAILVGSLLEEDTMAFMLTLEGVGVVTVVSVAYVFARKRLS